MHLSLVPRVSAVLMAIAVMLSGAPVEAAGPDTADRIDSYVRMRMPSLRTPGVSVVVVEGDHVLLSQGYGFSDLDTQRPMTDETPVPIASTNKGMTALATLQLVEQNQVNLDAPVVDYLPDLQMDD